MTTIYLPLYGQIKSIASAGGSNLLSLSHDQETGVFTLYSFDIKTIIDSTSQNEREDACIEVSLDALKKDEDPLYVLSSEDRDFLVATGGVYDVDISKRMLTHVISNNNIDFAQIITNPKTKDLAVIADGSLCIYSPNKKKYKLDKELSLSGLATALAVSTDGQTIAVGYESGQVEIFKKDGDGGDFSSIPSSLGSNPIQMHKDGSVLNLALVRYEDNRQFIVSFGSDRRAMQAWTEELVPSSRADTGLHTGLVTGMISNANTGRFYTISQDGEAKSWLSTRKKMPPQTVFITDEIKSATFVTYQGKRDKRRTEQKYLVAAGGSDLDSSIRFFDIEESSDDNATGGQIASQSLELLIGKDWSQEFQDGDSSLPDKHKEAVQEHVINVVSGWGPRFLDVLKSFASKHNSEEIQTKAIEAIAKSTSSSAQYILQDIASSIRNEKVLILIFEKIFSFDASLKTISLALETSQRRNSNGLFTWMLTQLASKAQKDREALLLLENTVLQDNLQLDYSLACYDALIDIDSSSHSIEIGLQNSNLTEIVLRDLYHTHKNRFNRSEIQMILAMYIRHSNSDFRDLALQLQLLSDKKLSDFARAHDQILHQNLCKIEENREGIFSAKQEMPKQPPVPKKISSILKDNSDILEQLCSNPYEDIASFGCLLATRLGSEDYLSAQLMFMTSDDPNIRKTAIEGLGFLDDPRSEAGLIKTFCKDSNASLRTLAYEQCKMNPLEKAKRGMNSDYTDVRLLVIDDLFGLQKGKTQKDASRLIVEMISQESNYSLTTKIWNEILHTGVVGSTEKTLTELANNANYHVRNFVRDRVKMELEQEWNKKILVAALNIDNPYEVTGWLDNVLRDRSKNLQLRKEDIVKVAIENKHAEVRSVALRYLQMNPCDDLSSELIRITTESENSSERSQAYAASVTLFRFLQGKKASGESKDTKKSTAFGRRFFKEAALSSFEDVQKQALETLGEEASGWRLTILEKALKDERAIIRSSAASALINSGLLSNAATLLKSPHLDLQVRAIQYFCKIGDDKAVSTMKKILDIAPPNKEDKAYFANNIYTASKFDHDYQLWKNHMIWTLSSARQLGSKKLLPEIHTIIEKSDIYPTEIRTIALEAMAFCMEPDSKKDIKILEECLGSSLSEIQHAAGVALGRIGNTQGFGVIWNSIEDKLKFQMLFALEDQTYIDRSIADGDSFIKELIQGFVLQSLVRGGDLNYLSSGLIAEDKNIVLFCARIIEKASDDDELLALLQRELNEWTISQLYQADVPYLSDNYHAYIEEVNTYYSFQELRDLNDRYRQIQIEEWSLVARLFADDDPRVRSSIAGLFYQFRVDGLDDESFLSQLSMLSTKHLRKKTLFKKIKVNKEDSISMAYNIYQRLVVDTSISRDIREESLYSYAQGSSNRKLREKTKLQLQNLLLDEEISESAFGYLWCNRKELGIKNDTDLIELLIQSPSERIQKMGLSLMVHANDETEIKKLVYNNRKNISVLAFEEFCSSCEDDEYISFLGDALDAKNSMVQSLAFDRLLEIYNELEEDEDTETSALDDILEIMKKGLNTSDKELKLRIIQKLGIHGVIDVLKDILQLAQTSTEEHIQQEFYSALVAICNRTRNKDGSLSKKMQNVAPTLVTRWFDDPTNTTDEESLIDALRGINDRSIIDTLFDRLESRGSNYDITNLIVYLTGDEDYTYEWDSLTKEDKDYYNHQNYDDHSLIRLGEYYLKNTQFGDLRGLIEILQTSIVPDSPLFGFLKKLSRLPNTKECNVIRSQVIHSIASRLKERKTIDSKEMQKNMESLLETLLDHKDKLSSFYAAQTLSLLGNGKGSKILFAKAVDTKEKDVSLRVLALESIGRLENPNSLKYLLLLAGYNEYFELLEADQIIETNEDIQIAALSAFGSLEKSKDADAIHQILIENLRSYNENKRQGSIKALAHFGEKGRKTLYDEYQNFWDDFDARYSIIQETESDENNTEWLKDMFLSEVRRDAQSWEDIGIYFILKSRNPDDLFPDVTLFEHGVVFDQNLSELTHKADDTTLLQMIRHNFFVTGNYAHENLLEVLIDTDKQRSLGRKEAYPQSLILEHVQQELTQALRLDHSLTQRIEYVQLFVPIAGKAHKNMLPAIEACRNLWVALQKRKDLGDTSRVSEQETTQNIWSQLLETSGSIGASERLACLSTENVPASMVLSLLSSIDVNKESMSYLTGLLSHRDRNVRSFVANVLSNTAVSDLTSVVHDVSSMFLLRGNSVTSMLKEAKNGSTLAISNLAKSGNVADLMDILDKAHESTQIKIINAIAAIGNKTALQALEKASKKGSKTIKDELKKACKRCEYRIEKQKKFSNKF